MKYGNSKKKLSFVFLLALAILSFPLISATNIEANTKINNVFLGQSFNVTMDSIVSFYVTNSTLGGDPDNIVLFDTPTSLFLNNTNSSSGYINLSSMTNTLIWNSVSGLVYGSTNISDNDGTINASIPSHQTLFALDNFNVTIGTSRDNDPLYDGVLTLDNTLADSVTFTIYGFNGGSLTDSSGTLIADGIYGPYVLTMTAGQTITISNDNYDNFCSTVTSSPGIFFSYIETFFVLLAVVIIILIVGIILVVLNDYQNGTNTIDYDTVFSSFSLKAVGAFLIGIFIIGIISIMLIIIVSTSCALL